MVNIGGGAPSTIWKVNLMGSKLTICQTITMNGLNEKIGIEKPNEG